jgi:hypothetical protein
MMLALSSSRHYRDDEQKYSVGEVESLRRLIGLTIKEVVAPSFILITVTIPGGKQGLWEVQK